MFTEIEYGEIISVAEKTSMIRVSTPGITHLIKIPAKAITDVSAGNKVLLGKGVVSSFKDGQIIVENFNSLKILGFNSIIYAFPE